jgi:hypothetical protein
VEVLLVLQPDRTVRHLKLEPNTHTEVVSRFQQWGKEFLEGRRRVGYTPAYQPEADEVLALSGYDPPPALLACSKAVPNSVGAVTAKSLGESPPSALVMVVTGAKPRFLFQSITARNRLDPKGGLLFGNGQFQLNKEAVLLLGHKIDAIIEAGTLLLKSEHTVRHFLDMEKYFAAATDATLDTFFGQAQFMVSDMVAVKAIANSVHRRKLQWIIDRGDVPSPKALQAAAKKHLALKLTIKDKALVVPTNASEFRQFVGLLNHDYVQSVVDEAARFVASSKRPLTGGEA